MNARGTATAALILLLAAAGSGAVRAQNYDGNTIIKFGVFGQGTLLDWDISRPVAGSASADGGGGGLSAGIDFTLHRRWLLGVEIDASLGDARTTFAGTSYGFDYLATLRARAGLYVGHHVLLYGTVGVGYLGFEAQSPTAAGKEMETVTGLVTGGGIEVDLQHMILFGEYLHADFGDRQFTLGGVRHETDAEAQVFRLGVKFKVGHDHFGRFYEPYRDTLK